MTSVVFVQYILENSKLLKHLYYSKKDFWMLITYIGGLISGLTFPLYFLSFFIVFFIQNYDYFYCYLITDNKLDARITNDVNI